MCCGTRTHHVCGHAGHPRAAICGCGEHFANGPCSPAREERWQSRSSGWGTHPIARPAMTAAVSATRAPQPALRHTSCISTNSPRLTPTAPRRRRGVSEHHWERRAEFNVP